MLKMLASVLCVILFAGVFAVAQAGDRERELELEILGGGVERETPREGDHDVRGASLDEWHRQLASGKPICPTIQELTASRNLMATGGVSTSVYTAARDSGDWLARCRAQVEWATSMLKQTPEGRAYLARVVAATVERLRLECGCEGTFQVFTTDSGGNGGGGPASIIVDTDRNRENQFTRIQTPTVSQVFLGLVLIMGMATIQHAQNMGWITPAQADALRAELGLGIGVAIGLGLLGPASRDPER